MQSQLKSETLKLRSTDLAEPEITARGLPTATDEIRRKRLRICVAGSGGGHLRQLFDLEPVWSKHDWFIVTEDTALSRSFSAQHPVEFVPHFAFGQLRQRKPFRMLGAALLNAWQSAKIIARTKPDVVITTGAGSIYFAALWARLWGAKIIAIESFARFDRLSLFGRLIAPIAHCKIVQSAKLSTQWPDARIFDPVRFDDVPRPAKKNLLFVSVGATFTFDRLIKSVDEIKRRGLIPEDVIAQTGEGGASPDGIVTVPTLNFDDMRATLSDADIVVCHGGTGTLITALRRGCRVVAMPRQLGLGEAYDDHQFEITSYFAKRGLIEVANSTEELAFALAKVRARRPPSFVFDMSPLGSHLDELLTKWSMQDAT